MMAAVPWPGVPWDDGFRKDQLVHRYDVDALPTMVVVDGDGEVLTVHGVDAVVDDPHCDFFPWQDDVVMELGHLSQGLNDAPCVIVFLDGLGEALQDEAVDLMERVAGDYHAECRGRGDAPSYRFFFALHRPREAKHPINQVRKLCRVPPSRPSPILLVLDIPARVGGQFYTLTAEQEPEPDPPEVPVEVPDWVKRMPGYVIKRPVTPPVLTVVSLLDRQIVLLMRLVDRGGARTTKCDSHSESRAVAWVWRAQ